MFGKKTMKFRLLVEKVILLQKCLYDHERKIVLLNKIIDGQNKKVEASKEDVIFDNRCKDITSKISLAGDYRVVGFPENSGKADDLRSFGNAALFMGETRIISLSKFAGEDGKMFKKRCLETFLDLAEAITCAFEHYKEVNREEELSKKIVVDVSKARNDSEIVIHQMEGRELIKLQNVISKEINNRAKSGIRDSFRGKI